MVELPLVRDARGAAVSRSGRNAARWAWSSSSDISRMSLGEMSTRMITESFGGVVLWPAVSLGIFAFLGVH